MAQDTTTLTIHWVFSCLAILIMMVRLIWRKAAKQPYIWGDYFTMVAILCALTRLALIHVVLIWGTSNVPKAVRLNHSFTPTEIYQREIGSQLSIANRFFYNS
jgi:cytochrome b561